MQKEEWKTIKVFDDYEISNFGRVKSFKRYKNGKILNYYDDSHGYLFVKLYINGKSDNKRIHRLVLETFVGINPDKPFCNHIDGNKENNYIENLEWCTHSENMKHAIETGLINNKGEESPNFGKSRSEEWKKEQSKRMKGENHPRSKLTEKNVIEIRVDLNEGILTQREIAEKFGVTQTIISNIKTGKRWKKRG